MIDRMEFANLNPQSRAGFPGGTAVDQPRRRRVCRACGKPADSLRPDSGENFTAAEIPLNNALFASAEISFLGAQFGERVEFDGAQFTGSEIRLYKCAVQRRARLPGRTASSSGLVASVRARRRTGPVDRGDSLRVGTLIRRYTMLLISSAAESAGQGVGGVPVEVVPGPVVAAGGAGVGVPGEVLHVAERNPRI